MVKYDEYLEFINASVTESAASTFTQSTINTPVGRSNNLAMCIHGILSERSGTLTHGAENDAGRVQMSSISQTSMTSIADPNVIWRRQDHTHWGSSVGFQVRNLVDAFWFPTPVLYAKSQLFVQSHGVNQGVAHTWYLKIAYTIRRVSLYKMVEALVE